MDGCVVDAGRTGDRPRAERIVATRGTLVARPPCRRQSPGSPAGRHPPSRRPAGTVRAPPTGPPPARQEGPELPALVARIRGLTERSLSSSLQAGEELRALLDGLDLGTTIRLVRAFSSHPRLATVAQQVHQVGELADLQHHRIGRLSQTVDR